MVVYGIFRFYDNVFDNLVNRLDRYGHGLVRGQVLTNLKTNWSSMKLSYQLLGWWQTSHIDPQSFNSNYP